MTKRAAERAVACPECNTRLGGWGFVLVHDFHYQRRFYRCCCGWHSTMHKTEQALIFAHTRLSARRAKQRRKG